MVWSSFLSVRVILLNPGDRMKKDDLIDLYFYGKFVMLHLGGNFDFLLQAFKQQLNALELK